MQTLKIDGHITGNICANAENGLPRIMFAQSAGKKMPIRWLESAVAPNVSKKDVGTHSK